MHIYHCLKLLELGDAEDAVGLVLREGNNCASVALFEYFCRGSPSKKEVLVSTLTIKFRVFEVPFR
jgi:hypothetical protein